MILAAFSTVEDFAFLKIAKLYFVKMLVNCISTQQFGVK